MVDEEQRTQDMKWRKGFREGFFAAIDAMNRGYTVEQMREFAGHGCRTGCLTPSFANGHQEYSTQGS